LRVDARLNRLTTFDAEEEYVSEIKVVRSSHCHLTVSRNSPLPTRAIDSRLRHPHDRTFPDFKL
jgi:hypothetical protein